MLGIRTRLETTKLDSAKLDSMKGIKNKDNIIEGALFHGYSKRKLYCLSETYGQLAQLYRQIPEETTVCDDRKDMLYQRQMHEAKEVFANHLDEISGAFADVADTVVHVSMPVEHKRKAIVQYLRKQGIIVRELIFLENSSADIGTMDGRCPNRISLSARTVGRQTISADVLGRLLSVFFGRKLVLSGESATVIGKCYDTFLYEDEPRYQILSAISRAVKENEKISGDNFSMEEYNQSQMILMIADGMGSGRQACRDSQAVIEFMERFLEAGFCKEKAFSMVNNAIASQNACCNLTTLDVCAVNLLTGEAELIKAGAAPSFIKHGGYVDEVSADTLPLGSMDALSPIVQTIHLADTDMLVMVSDGVSDAFENEGQIREVIARNRTVNPKELSDCILQHAINSQGGRIRDDMTVLVCTVKRRQYLPYKSYKL